MLSLIVTISLLQFIALSLSIVSILSNEWFYIGIKASCQKWNCVNTDYYESVIRYGLWYSCPFFRGNSDDGGLAWVFDATYNKCFEFASFTSDRLKTPNVYAKYLKNQNLLDIEPSQIGSVRVLLLIGTFCLLITTIWSLILLIFICRSPKSVKNSWNMQATSLSIFIFIDFTTRLIGFIIFAINSSNYLDHLFRTSYTLMNNKNYFRSEYDDFIRNLVNNYRISSHW